MSDKELSRLAQQLVVAVVPELGDDRALAIRLKNHAVRKIRVDARGGQKKEWDDVRQTLQGLSRTAKIRVQEDLAEALEKNLRTIERYRSKGKARARYSDGDGFNMDNLPQYVHFLLNLSERPTASTHDFAHSYLHRVPPSGLTADQVLYHQIMESEPFDPGEIWDEEVFSGWTESESESDVQSSESDSPEEEEVRTPSSAAIRAQRKRHEAEARRLDEEQRQADAAALVADLKDGYWNSPGEVGVIPDGLYGWKDLTTSSKSAAICRAMSKDPLLQSKAITASQLQRELIFALSGRPGVMFSFARDGTCSTDPRHPLVHHLSPAALENILADFQEQANRAAYIRTFIAKTTDGSIACTSRVDSRTPVIPTSQIGKTQQAFAEACREIMVDFDTWLSNLEAAFTGCDSSSIHSSSLEGASPATTPSVLLITLEKSYGEILDWISSFIPHSTSPTVLLNLIHSTIICVEQTGSTGHISSLHRLFALSAVPTWGMLGDWLERGMPIPSSLLDPDTPASTSDDGDERPLDNEFFIKRDRDVSWIDEDFWECGFIVGDEGWPEWLGDGLGEMILESGKAKGLLRSLVGSIGLSEEWTPLLDILDGTHLTDTEALQHGLATEHDLDVTSRISGYLRPMCQITQFHLRRVLEEECGLEEHLDAIEGLFFHCAFDVLREWTQGLYKKVASNERWADFHALTSTFRDTIERNEAGWLNPSAIRIRTVRTQGAYVGPRALGAIRAHYEVPFPLSQLFTPTSIELRSEVFTFLLQLQMGRYLLSQTKIHDRELFARLNDGGEGEIRAMWSMRQKLSWFIDTLLAWLTARVIEQQKSDLRKKLENMTSLRSMIALELEHARRIRCFAFLHASTLEIHESIQVIFDLIQTLSDCSDSCVLQNIRPTETTNAKRQIQNFNHVTQRRRKAKPKRQRRPSVSSDEEGEAPKEASISFIDLSLGERMKRMDHELDEQVGIIRDGVETMAMGTDEDGQVWGMLDFALRDWKVAT
ncbi:hypothetical protein IAU59_001512 [Kwoniella sp. CBS 9459]